ncbi:MAG: nickel-responsive regulator 1, partial [Candidatus Altiarchaeales archaeon HGW-Altiarchaeales-2]
MPIVSISLNAQILKEIDDTQKKFGFSGRSEIIRTAIRMLNEDYKQKEDLSGDIDAVLLV